MADYPDDYAYTRDHEWVSVDGDVGTIGITDHAQSELGDVVYIELPPVGEQLGQRETFGTIESVKAVSELYSPVSGEVIEVHNSLVDGPELVNEDPHGAAWMIRVQLSNRSQLASLMDAATYRALVEESA